MSRSPAIIPVVLSGGAGTRLWPLSRHLRPKQFLDLLGDGDLFAETVRRVGGEGFADPIVICNDDHRFLVAEDLRGLGVAGEILLEPVGRNTAPAIAVAAYRALAGDPDALLLVLPSDHVIADGAAFHGDVHAAAAQAAEGRLVTFGVTPTRAETGYGYIRRGDAIAPKFWTVASFVEKPDAPTAETYVADGGYLWNAGIFLFGARAFLAELAAHHPEIVAAAAKAVDGGRPDLDFYRLDADAFAAAPALSVDVAVMDKTSRAVVRALSSAWSDVGSWAGLWELGEPDPQGNVTAGRSVLIDARDNYVRSDGTLVAAVGVEGLVIVATDDSILVLPRDRAQDVKQLVAAVERAGGDETISHTRVYRPWGHYQNLDAGAGFLVKQIVVKPGAKLSLQHHNRRAEHWVVVEGTARVTNGDDTFELAANQSTYIPVGTRHRLENPGDAPLRLIEVQTGDYIAENDIVRHEDTYGRS